MGTPRSVVKASMARDCTLKLVCAASAPAAFVEYQILPIHEGVAILSFHLLLPLTSGTTSIGGFRCHFEALVILLPPSSGFLFCSVALSKLPLFAHFYIRPSSHHGRIARG